MIKTESITKMMFSGWFDGIYKLNQHVWFMAVCLQHGVMITISTISLIGFVLLLTSTGVFIGFRNEKLKKELEQLNKELEKQKRTEAQLKAAVALNEKLKKMKYVEEQVRLEKDLKTLQENFQEPEEVDPLQTKMLELVESNGFVEIGEDDIPEDLKI